MTDKPLTYYEKELERIAETAALQEQQNVRIRNSRDLIEKYHQVVPVRSANDNTMF